MAMTISTDTISAYERARTDDGVADGGGRHDVDEVPPQSDIAERRGLDAYDDERHHARAHAARIQEEERNAQEPTDAVGGRVSDYLIILALVWRRSALCTCRCRAPRCQ
jgi:hypothetical protein